MLQHEVVEAGVGLAHDKLAGHKDAIESTPDVVDGAKHRKVHPRQVRHNVHGHAGALERLDERGHLIVGAQRARCLLERRGQLLGGYVELGAQLTVAGVCAELAAVIVGPYVRLDDGVEG